MFTAQVKPLPHTRQTYGAVSYRQRVRSLCPLPAAAAGSASFPDQPKDPKAPAEPPAPQPNAADFAPVTEKKGFLQRVKEFFGGSKAEKEKLAALGLAAFASYGEFRCSRMSFSSTHQSRKTLSDRAHHAIILTSAYLIMFQWFNMGVLSRSHSSAL